MRRYSGWIWNGSAANYRPEFIANVFDAGITSPLTPRQREVLQLIARGRSVKEIAAILNVAARTVEFHKYRIIEELVLRTVAELTQYAIKHGILPL